MHSSTKWLIAEIAVISVVLTLLGFAGYPSLLPYEWHKLLHIFGAVIFLGNIIVTGVWMFLAERNRERATLHFASEVVNWADVLFTAPGVLLVLVNGLIMVTRWGGIGTSWVAVGLGLFTLSGIVWVGFLLRYQNRLIQLSSNPVVSGEQLPEAFFQTLHRWYFWGIVATILPLISLVLMVVKPRFW
jgi:uncharacterized membrane protein